MKLYKGMTKEELPQYLQYCKKQLRLCKKENRPSAGSVWEERINQVKEEISK